MDVDVHVVDVGDAGGQALVGGGGHLVTMLDRGGGIDLDRDVGREAVSEPAHLDVGHGADPRRVSCFLAGTLKSVYDLVLWRWFHHVPLPDETAR